MKQNLKLWNAEEKLAVDSLRRDKSIVISKPDKGQSVAILKKTDYISKTEAILQDKTIFQAVESDNNVDQLSKFQGCLYRLVTHEKFPLDEQDYEEFE